MTNAALLSPDRKLLSIIFSLALLSRLFYVCLYEGHNYYAGISKGYELLAVNYLDGNGFNVPVDVAPLSSPSPQMVRVPFMTRPLGYAVFLIAIFSAVGVKPVAVQVLEAFLNATTPLLLFLIVKRIFNTRIAVVSAIVAALWPVTSRFEISLLPDSMVCFFLLLSTYFFVRALQDNSLKYVCFCGIAIGSSILVKPNGALLALFFGGFMIVSTTDRARFARAGLLIIVSLVMLIPNIMRNYEHTGHIVPFGLGSGISLWEGISDFGDTLGTFLDDKKIAELEGYRDWAYPLPVEREQARVTYAVKVIVEHPWWYCTVILRRIPLILTVHPSLFVSPSLKEFKLENPRASTIDYVRSYPGKALVVAFIAAISYALILLSLAGLWLERARWRVSWIPWIVPCCFVLLHIIQHTESRYFYPAIAHLVPLAVVAVFRMSHIEYSSSKI